MLTENTTHILLWALCSSLIYIPLTMSKPLKTRLFGTLIFTPAYVAIGILLVARPSDPPQSSFILETLGLIIYSPLFLTPLYLLIISLLCAISLTVERYARGRNDSKQILAALIFFGMLTVILAKATISGLYYLKQ